MTAGADLHAGKSADQIAAEEFGKETQLASLEIALGERWAEGAPPEAIGNAGAHEVPTSSEVPTSVEVPT